MKIDENELANQTRKALATLTPRKELVLRLKFGIDIGEALNNAQIAEQLGLSTQYIAQLEREALRDLRNPKISIQFKSSFSSSFDKGTQNER